MRSDGPLEVLLIEDNPGDADLTREVLESHGPSTRLTVAVDGVEAMELLRRDLHPDLVILDLNLPRKDGYEVLEEIKRDGNLGDVPVVILTSSDANRDVVHCYEIGANCYITKPMDFRSFQDIVGKAARFWLGVASRRVE